MGHLRLGVLLGLVLSAAWFARDYTLTKSENDALRAGQKQSGEVIRILGDGLAKQQERAAQYRDLYEELSHVQDDDSCRSPAIDRAFELLRQRRASD